MPPERVHSAHGEVGPLEEAGADPEAACEAVGPCSSKRGRSRNKEGGERHVWGYGLRVGLDKFTPATRGKQQAMGRPPP